MLSMTGRLYNYIIIIIIIILQLVCTLLGHCVGLFNVFY